MLNKLIRAYKYYITLRAGDFGKFTRKEAFIDALYEFFL